jgi:hypothetical protein
LEEHNASTSVIKFINDIVKDKNIKLIYLISIVVIKQNKLLIVTVVIIVKIVTNQIFTTSEMEV